MRNTSIIGRILKLAGLSAALMLALLQPAFAASNLDLKTEAFKEVTSVGPDGKKVVKRVPLTRATPGTEVIYVITYHNLGAQPVADIKIDNPVPKDLVYETGSALGEGTVAEFSVDGGKHFGALNTLKVTGPDGQQHDAQGRDVTTIRWTLKDAVKPGAEGFVSYRAMLP